MVAGPDFTFVQWGQEVSQATSQVWLEHRALDSRRCPLRASSGSLLSQQRSQESQEQEALDLLEAVPGQ